MSFLALPLELRFQIFDHVTNINGPQPPSIQSFAGEPSIDLTRASQTPLKNCSLVCKAWRGLVSPILFRHARISSLDNRRNLKSVEQAVSDYCAFARDRTLSGRGLHEFVSSLTIVTNSDVLAAAWSGPRSPMDGPDPRHISVVASIWHQIFKLLVNLETISIVAPVATMAALLSTCEQTTETWVFEMPYHYLRLSVDPLPRKTRSLNFASWQEYSSSVKSSDRCRGQAIIEEGIPPLVHARDWRHLAYNEGTMITAYSHYEWQWKVPPKILRSLLGQFIKKARGAESRGQGSIRLHSIEYISLFPLANHVETTFLQDLIRTFDPTQTNNVLIEENDDEQQSEQGSSVALTDPSTFPLHDLGKFTLRLADSDLLDDRRRMGRSDRTDCWSEWENSYRVLMTNLLAKLPKGAIFETKGGKEMEYAVEDVLIRYREVTREFRAGWKKRWADGLVWDKIGDLERRDAIDEDEDLEQLDPA